MQFRAAPKPEAKGQIDRNCLTSLPPVGKAVLPGVACGKSGVALDDVRVLHMDIPPLLPSGIGLLHDRFLLRAITRLRCSRGGVENENRGHQRGAGSWMAKENHETAAQKRRQLSQCILPVEFIISRLPVSFGNAL